jgi:hypothetical protein
MRVLLGSKNYIVILAHALKASAVVCTERGINLKRISELCCSMYCLRVNVYCTTATGWQSN